MSDYRVIEFNMLGASGTGGFDVFVDSHGKPYAFVPMGGSIQIKLDRNPHVIGIELAGQYKNTLEPRLFRIEAGGDNHRYFCKIKRGLWRGTLEVTEDSNVLEENRKRRLAEQTWLQKNRDNREADALFSSLEELLMAQPVENREYERLVSDDIPANLRFSDTYKARLKEFCKKEIAAAALSFPDKHLIGLYLNGLAKIPECSEAMEKLLKNQKIVCDDLVRTMPIFSVESDIFEQIQKLKADWDDVYKGKTENEIYEDIFYTLTDDVYSVTAINEYNKNGEYIKALRAIMFSEYDENDVRKYMRLVAYLKVYLAISDFKPDTMFYVNEVLESVNKAWVAMCKKQTDGTGKCYPTFNDIVANIYIYNKGNYIENINKQLEAYIESIRIIMMNNLFEVDLSYFTEVFEMLRKIFEHFKAYNQEKIILEGMYECNIPRTPQQEQRLAFLKKGRTTAPEILDAAAGEDTLLFDYRTIKWNMENFNDYIENYTMQSKKINMPMVIAEWNKSIQGYKIKWDINEIEKALTECMADNFDDQYCLSIKQAGPVTEAGCETEPSILITENGDIKYPYIAYLVTGERMTAKQINMGIYAMIMPELCAEEDMPAIEFNKKVLEKCKVAVERQNPKLNNTIELMKTVIIEELESWLQKHYSRESLYD